MSDQDFFFDEEEEVAKEAKPAAKISAKSTAKPAPVARTSAPKPAADQDFFFDEEEEVAKEAKPAAKTSAKSTAKPAPVARPSAPKPAADRPADTSATPLFEQSVSMTVAALMAVIGLLIGVIIGFVVAPDSATVTTQTPAATTGTGSTAPQLSDEQLSSGALPEGHPDIGSAGATGTPETPSP